MPRTNGSRAAARWPTLPAPPTDRRSDALNFSLRLRALCHPQADAASGPPGEMPPHRSPPWL
ncbi:hypothetical protein E2562_009125 [Oryza meyeriana var. granulata]|uniref:Uncharacterized protein n=1 Tax=Oryza meyeriana var. granulata TaxID=110450 RepID=A0A6G1CZT4_9ORYZ|nr:hypothetical protein E2562_009125 [Oryza meyeriana var. granulata]